MLDHLEIDDDVNRVVGQWKLGESVPEDSFEIGLVEQIGLWVAVGLIVRIALESSENLMIGVNDLKA